MIAYNTAMTMTDDSREFTIVSGFIVVGNSLRNIPGWAAFFTTAGFMQPGSFEDYMDARQRSLKYTRYIRPSAGNLVHLTTVRVTGKPVVLQNIKK